MAIHPKLQLCVLFLIQRKESQMDHGQLSMVADKFQWVFSESLLNACGKDTSHSRSSPCSLYPRSHGNALWTVYVSIGGICRLYGGPNGQDSPWRSTVA